MAYQVTRGTRDILPDEQQIWRFVEKNIVAVCQEFGYDRIDTPLFEEASLFQRGVGEDTDIVEKEMYTFADKGGNPLSLKPEGTAPVCRAYIEHGMFILPQPVKLYYITPAYRYERPQAGRLREHHQFGYEALGEGDPALDAEVIEMACRFYQRLGLGDEYNLIINSIGCRECRPVYIEKLKKYYENHLSSLCQDCRNRFVRNPLRLLDCKKASCREAAKDAPPSWESLCESCSQHLESLKSYLETLGLNYKLDHRLVRGFDYYTRTVFEVQPHEEGAQSTLGGGGRYDGLIEELGGKPTPGVGFATGMERIIEKLKKRGLPGSDSKQVRVYIAYQKPEYQKEAVKLASTLRKSGVATLLAYGPKSLKAQLRQAGSLKIKRAIILGEEELKEDSLITRDMEIAEQSKVKRKELIEKIDSFLEKWTTK